MAFQKRLQKKLLIESDPTKEDRDLLTKRINRLRELIKQEDNLLLPDDDEFLGRFLRSRKFDVDKAYQRVRAFLYYFHTRTRHTEMLSNLYPSLYSSLYAKGFVTVLKSRDSQGRQVFIVRTRKWKPDEISLDDVLLAVYIVIEEMIADERSQLNGISIIIDFMYLSFYQARQCTTKRIQRIMEIVQDTLPVSFKEIHFVHHPYIFNMVYSMIRPFLKEKMRKRLCFHGYDLSSLRKCIKPDILPSNLGGTLGIKESEDDQLFKRLYDKDDFYREFFRYGYRNADGSLVNANHSSRK